MKPKINISESVVKRLKNSSNSCCGKLYGIATQSEIVVLAICVDQNDVEFKNCLPAGIDFCGIFNIADEASHYDPEIISNAVFIGGVVGKNDLKVHIEESGKYISTLFNVVLEQHINNTYFYIRTKGHIPFQSEFTKDALKETFETLHKTIPSELVFGIFKSNIFFSANEINGVEDNISLKELCEDSFNINEDFNKKKVTNVKPTVIEFNILRKLTTNKSSELIKDHAPIGILDKRKLIKSNVFIHFLFIALLGPTKVVNTTLELDSLAVVKNDIKIKNLYNIMLESIKRLLNIHQAKLLSFLKNSTSTKSLVHQVYHYYPDECQHFITVLYAKDQSESDLKASRLLLHKHLGLQTNSPCFRRSNQYMFEKNLNGPLINPHEGLKPTLNEGVVALVKGKYEYFHYCQNKMDDNGWGCAYRSLQTLASWFKLQGYVNREVPTFSEIQQCLVDIKDKPSSFVGSRQWIGSTEVNFVLNSLLGIENKILYVSSGEDMPSKGPELVSHFQNHGSPVMIGGGVLAHTILGVDYNQQTGEIKFLILDPHYTGDEDLHTIQSKGWCGWKNATFWDKNSYYNMCLPLVPREV
ncbi:unnamed protein product [Phyllotreta striolata]|uniref:Probable Ufm1-specific protease 2 n=1 Tax=Phyllotreta striolata TaxID=444603 RepID=A0A9N9TPA9_PHYSR|nr:unnamed protein product [Phyllotreta striolata]